MLMLLASWVFINTIIKIDVDIKNVNFFITRTHSLPKFEKYPQILSSSM